MGKLISQAAYARLRGCTKQAVYKAVRSGRIKLVDGKVDPDLADRQWAANTKGAPEPKTKRGPRKSKADQEGTETRGTGFAAANAAWKQAQAQRELLRLRKEAGELVEADAVERVLVAAMVNHGKDLSGLADRVARRLEGKTTAEIREILEREVVQIRDRLADSLAQSGHPVEVPE